MVDFITYRSIRVQHGSIDKEAGNVMSGALKYKEMKVVEVMTPVEKVYMLSVTEKLNLKVLSVLINIHLFPLMHYDDTRLCQKYSGLVLVACPSTTRIEMMSLGYCSPKTYFSSTQRCENESHNRDSE